MTVLLTGVSGAVAVNTLNGYLVGATLVTFAGTPAGNCVISFPPTADIWVMYNNATMGTYSLKVKTSTGSISHPLVYDERAPFFTNGSDMLTVPSPTAIEAQNFATAMAVAFG